MMELVVSVMLLLALILSVYFDVSERRIPNFITIPLLLIALMFMHRPEGVAAWPVLYVAWQMRAIGGGDAKLLAAISIIQGPGVAGFALLLGGLLAFKKKPAPGAIGAMIAALPGVSLTLARFCGIM